MREYDGVDYLYKSEDHQSEKAVKFLHGLLGFQPSTSDLKYELNFYAGGIGVDDKLAFSCSMTESEIESVRRKLRLVSPNEALNDQAWGEDFAWLLGDKVDEFSIVDRSIEFINKNRKPFQKRCSEEWRTLFSQESDVNAWTAAWIFEGTFNYLSFAQG